MNRIASDEPEEVGLIPKPITFWHGGRQHQATVSKSSRRDVIAFPFHGDQGRAWLADPCSMALVGSIRDGREALQDERRRLREVQRKLKGG